MVEVDACLEGGALHAEPRLGGAVALHLVDPDHPVQPPPGRHGAARDDGPRAVALVVVELGSLRLHPHLSSQHSLCVRGGCVRRVSAQGMGDLGQQGKCRALVISQGHIELDRAAAARQPGRDGAQRVEVSGRSHAVPRRDGQNQRVVAIRRQIVGGKEHRGGHCLLDVARQRRLAGLRVEWHVASVDCCTSRRE